MESLNCNRCVAGLLSGGCVEDTLLVTKEWRSRISIKVALLDSHSPLSTKLLSRILNRSVKHQTKDGQFQLRHRPASKLGSEFRFCVDYRRVYKQTADVTQCLPRIHKGLKDLEKSSIFITLDLKSGYCQIPLTSRFPQIYRFLHSRRWPMAIPGCAVRTEEYLRYISISHALRCS